MVCWHIYGIFKYILNYIKMKKIEKHFNVYDCYATEKPNGNYNLGIYVCESNCIFEKEVTKDTMEEILENESNVNSILELVYFKSVFDNSMTPVDCKFFK